jgi:hypothetical protein
MMNEHQSCSTSSCFMLHRYFAIVMDSEEAHDGSQQCMQSDSVTAILILSLLLNRLYCSVVNRHKT